LGPLPAGCSLFWPLPRMMHHENKKMMQNVAK
jgi:hypothetical protein